MNTLRRSILMMGLTLLVSPGLGLAQEPLGVVTTLSGQATRTASATPDAAAPLRFKDGVFGADTIRTAERAFVRMLLERKAVLTVRELSVLRIAEDATQAMVDLRSGGLAFSVARPRLRPGEAVLIHTPNAVAAVRGTSIVVETQGAVSHFHVLTGTLDVASRANPTAWQRLQAPASLTVTGAVVGAVRTLDAGTRERLSADYLGLRLAEPSAPAEIVAQEQAKAVLLARLIGGDGGGGDGDQIDMLAVGNGPMAQAAPGIHSPTQVPVVPPVAPAAPATPAAPPLWSWNNQTATVTGDLYNVPAATTASLNSGLASATGSAITVTNEVVDVTGTLTASAAAPLIALQSSTLGSRNLALVQVGSLSLTGGPLLGAVGGGVSTTDDLLRVTGGGDLLGPSAGPLLSLSGTTLTVGNGAGDRLLDLTGAGSTVNLGGGLLAASGSTVSLPADDLVSITAGGRLTSTGTGPLLAFASNTVSIGNGAGDQLFVVNGAGSRATLAGPLLSAAGSALSLTGSALVEVSTSATLTDTSAQRLVSLSGGTLTLSAGASAFLLNTSATATLAGGLLDATGTNITAAGDFVRALGGGRIVVTGSTAPLLSLTGGTHQFGAAGNIYRLSGTATAVDPVSGLLLGTAQPIQAAGSLFESVGATATTQRAVRLDVALLQASAPLLSLRANGAVAGGLTTTSHTIDLTSRAKLNVTAPVIALDGSRLTVTNASVVNVAGGSYLGVTGNLLSVANGSQITVTGGALLFATGGSVVSISGALLSFGGTGSTVTVSNAFCPCTMIGGIPVRLTGGALAANVSITNPVQNAAGNTVSIGAGAAAISVTGATTRVTISGQ